MTWRRSSWPSSSSKLRSVLAHVYALAVWATREALPPDLDRWEQDDVDDFLAHLATERTNPRSGAQGLDSISIRGYVNTLRTLHLLRAQHSDTTALRRDCVLAQSTQARNGYPPPSRQHRHTTRDQAHLEERRGGGWRQQGNR